MKIGVIIMAALLAFASAQACVFPIPGDRDNQRLDAKESVRLLAPHCTAWSGATALDIEFHIEVEDFGPPDGDSIDISWSLGDGRSGNESRPRPSIVSGRPSKYRIEKAVRHSYAQGGTYSLQGSVKNGSRTATCTASITVGARMVHPQG